MKVEHVNIKVMNELVSDTNDALPPLYERVENDPELLFQGSDLITDIPVDRNSQTVLEIVCAIEEAGGRIPFSRFMEICLYGNDGYYSSGKVKIGRGKENDFCTAPETSPFFGAAMASMAEKVWKSLGKPSEFIVVEMGAGKGGMAEGFLRWAEEIGGDFNKALKYKIVEYSPALIHDQQERVSGENSPEWIRGSAYDLPLGGIVGMVLTNELFDAFPVDRVARINGQLRQKYIGIENSIWVEYWGDLSDEVAGYVFETKLRIPEGCEEPVNSKALDLQKKLVNAVRKGVVVTIDYGRNDTVGSHKSPSVRYYSSGSNSSRKVVHGSGRDAFAALEFPGDIDITASINFKLLEEAAFAFAREEHKNLDIIFSGSQRDFLLKAGIEGIWDREAAKAKAETAWIAKLRLWYEVFIVNKLLLMPSFYAQVMSIGIDPSSIDWSVFKEEYPPRPEKLNIQLGTEFSGKKIVVVPRVAAREKTVLADVNGMIELSVLDLDDAYFMDESGTIIFDKESVLKKAEAACKKD